MLLAPLLLSLGCFSTIAPDRETPTTPGGGGGGKTSVSGVVMQFLGPGNFRDVVGTTVRVIWLASGTVVGEQNVRTDDNGVFSASSSLPKVTHVRISAHKCNYNPSDPAPRFICCLTSTSCECESIWDAAVQIALVTGSNVQKNLITSCIATP